MKYTWRYMSQELERIFRPTTVTLPWTDREILEQDVPSVDPTLRYI